MKRLAVCLALVLTAAPAWAQRSLAIKHFDAVIVVGRDGSVDVTETITAMFYGKWNGIYRTIPVEYRTLQNRSWTLRLEVISVTDSAGNPLKVDRSREQQSLKYKIWVPGAEDAARTVVFHYRALNGLRYFEDHDELYWNVTGNQWDVPVEGVTARIELPPAATGVRAIAVGGLYGSRSGDIEVTVDGTTARFSLVRPLEYQEGVTAVVGWDKGAVLAPTVAATTKDLLRSSWPLALPLFVFLFMFLLWRRVGRDPERRPVTVQYEPPLGLTPAETGALLDQFVHGHDITATIVDLAVAGYLRIEEEETKVLGLFPKTDFLFHRLRPSREARPLEPHETAVLDGMFKSQVHTVRLSDLSGDFYKQLPGIREGVYRRLIKRGLYRSRPDNVIKYWILGGVAFGVLVAGIGNEELLGRAEVSSGINYLAAGLSALIVALFGLIMPARTVAGARAYEGARGFEEFLRRVESGKAPGVDRTPAMFERFLPYAIAFGVEQQWARSFQDIVHRPPTWYIGPGRLDLDFLAFTGRLGTLTTRAAGALVVIPRGASFVSGFAGGFVGGGFGGGGGGGF
jgi:hypothetical protein